MKKTWTFGLLLAVAALGTMLWYRTEAATPAATSTRPAAGQMPRLIFFMNPNGAPCQMQDRILQGMGADLRARVEVVYYRTTNPSDIAMFQQYGIRSLPSLVLTDASGRELRRATPGIHSPAQVLQLIGQ